MKNPIELTPLLAFSLVFFIMGTLNSVWAYPDATYFLFNIMTNYHIFEISLVLGLVFSVRKNYRRARIYPSKIMSKTLFFVSLDFVFMLLGVFASQLVVLVFTYTQNDSLRLMVGVFSAAVIGTNLCRKPFLDSLVYRIH